MIEAILWVLLELFGELALQLLFEVACRAIYSLLPFQEERPSPWWILLGWILAGAFASAVALLFLPNHVVQDVSARTAATVFVPVLLGSLTWAHGRFLDDRNRLVLPMDNFWYGYGFGFAFGLVRLLFAR